MTTTNTIKILGTIGGLLGILVGISYWILSPNNTDPTGMAAAGQLIIILSTLGIIGSYLITTQTKLGASLILIAAFFGLILATTAWIIPGITLGYAGYLAAKETPQTT